MTRTTSVGRRRAATGVEAPTLSSATALATLTVTAIVSSMVLGANPVLLALVGGIAATNLSRGRLTLTPALSDLLLKRVLRTAIVLLGATVDLQAITALGVRPAVAIVLAIVTALGVTTVLGRWARLDRDLTVLVAVGCAICGASAIAAVAPVIAARRELVGLALGTVFSLNAVALLSLGAIGATVGLDATAMGTWAGVAVHDTASAVAAGFAAGPDAGQTATVVKLARTVALVPLVAVVAVVVSRRGSSGDPATDGAPSRGWLRTALSALPLFVVGFLLFAVLGSFLLPSPVTDVAGEVARLAIVAVVAGIGMTLRWTRLVTDGRAAVLVGLGASVAVAVVTLLVLVA